MFYKQCDDSNDHDEHVWTKHWVRKELKDLLHPELYPAEWDARYHCPGLTVSAWTAEMLHDDCTGCEACADMAVEEAKRRGEESSVWRQIGIGEVILHMAEVKRV